jgi:hypothetical protein
MEPVKLGWFPLQNSLGLFATSPKLAKTCWASLLPRQSSPKLAGPLCYLAKTCRNLLGLSANMPKLAKTCWASLLPRQNSPKLAGPLCYLAKTRQNLLGLFATSPKLAKTCWASLLPRQNSPKLAGPLCYLAKVARKQKQRLERSQGNQPEQGTDTMFAADLKPKVTRVGLAT